MRVIPRQGVNLTIGTCAKAFMPFGKKYDYLQKFQTEFAEYAGSKYALGLSSARIALYLALKCLNLEKGAEIIVSAYNFPPLILVMKLMGYKPVFVDIHPLYGTIDADKISQNITPKTKLIILTHMFGYPADIDKVMRIAKENNLYVIEDCAQALGAKYKGRMAGTFGDMGIYSFGYGKIMPCFGGGMIVTNKPHVYEMFADIIKKSKPLSLSSQLKSVINTAGFYFLSHRYIFPWTLYPVLRFCEAANSKFIEKHTGEKTVMSLDSYETSDIIMSRLQAKTGLLMLKKVKDLLEKTIVNANELNRIFSNADNVKILKPLPDTEPAYLYYKIIVKNKEKLKKDLLVKGIDVKIDDMCVPGSLPGFEVSNNEFPAADNFLYSNLEVPHGATVSLDEIKYIGDMVKKYAG